MATTVTATARTMNEILHSPQLDDTISGKLLGYRGSSRYVKFARVACPSCGTHHWVRNTIKDKSHPRCYNCPTFLNRPKINQYRPERLRKYRPDAEGNYKTILVSDIPKNGDLIRGSEIGRSPLFVFRWTPCPSCGVGRWIMKNTQGKPMCKDCGNKHKMNKYIGNKSSRWKGGKIVSHYGYIYVRTYSDSPFWSMANQLGYVAEHRLVMAQHLGRPLERREIVHHKHVRFATGTIENKQDNCIDNLELVPSRGDHDAITILENKIHELEQQIVGLKSKLSMYETIDNIARTILEREGGSDLIFRRAE